MTKRKSHPRVGSDFEDLLREEGRLAQATAVAVKRVARRMKTSRAATALSRRVKLKLAA